MPYIKNDYRDRLFAGEPWLPIDAGELAYVITRHIHAYFDRGPQSYAKMAEIIGVLVTAKDEFTRRVIRPYEDRKIQENGDVLPDSVRSEL